MGTNGPLDDPVLWGQLLDVLGLIFRGLVAVMLTIVTSAAGMIWAGYRWSAQISASVNTQGQAVEQHGEKIDDVRSAIDRQRVRNGASHRMIWRAMGREDSPPEIFNDE